MSVWPIPSCDADVDIPVCHGAPVRVPSYSTEADNLVGVTALFTPAGPGVIHPAFALLPLATIVTSLRLTNEVKTSAALITMLEMNIRADHDRLMIRKVADIRWMRVHEDSVLGELLSK